MKDSMKHLLEGAKEDFKKGKEQNQSISTKPKNPTEIKVEKTKEEDVNKTKKITPKSQDDKNEESNIILKKNNENTNNLKDHLTNSLLRDFKDDILDEVKFQEYIYKTISKRFEIIAKNNKVSKYLIINSVLAQFLKENDDDVQEEIKRFKKKLNDF